MEAVKSAAAAVASSATASAVSVKETAERELRKREVTSGASTTTEKKPAPQLAQAVAPTVQGVPVKITAALCFLAFMIAYLFF